MKIEIISGSPRVGCSTCHVAMYLHSLFQEKAQHQTGLIDVREHPLEMVQQVWTSPEKAPEQHRTLAARMFAAQAFILVTPEYNGSYSPAMKNLLDHFPKQFHKAFGLVTASPGALGGIRASQQMQLLVNALFGICSPVMLIAPQVDKKFDEAGRLTDAAFQGSIDNFVAEFLWLAERVAAGAA